MQTPEALHRVACECVDRPRRATASSTPRSGSHPSCTSSGGLSLDAVVDAVLAGFRDGGVGGGSGKGRRIRVRCLVTAMRHAARSREIAELAIRFRDMGSSASTSPAPRPAIRRPGTSTPSSTCEATNAHFTIHAGEAFGLPSIHEAIAFCGADRLGHGVRIVDDITVHADGTATLGLTRELCAGQADPAGDCVPSSNVQTGAVRTIEEHPFDLLARLRFRVTVNTDNRLMSDTTMTPGDDRDWSRRSATAGRDLERFTINAMKSAFIPFDERLELIDDVIKPGYAVLVG